MSPRKGSPRTQARARSGQSRTGSAEKCVVFSTDAERVRRGRRALLPQDQTRDIADTFKVLAHPTRVKMIRALGSGEMCVCELSEVLGLSLSATSHQLHQLKDLRLVRSRADGKLVHYALHDRYVLALLDDCARHVSGEERAP